MWVKGQGYSVTLEDINLYTVYCAPVWVKGQGYSTSDASSSYIYVFELCCLQFGDWHLEKNLEPTWVSSNMHGVILHTWLWDMPPEIT